MKLFLIILITINEIFAADSYKLANEAVEAEKLGNFELAVQLLDSAYKVSNNEKHLFNKALIFYKTKQFNQVINIMTKFIYNTEPNIQYFRLLISSYDFLGKQKDARTVLQSALEYFPESALMYYELGVIEIGAGKRIEAREAWEKALYYNPNLPIVYYQLTKFFYDSDYRILSLIYGEMFLNMISTDDKKKEISTLLFEIYEDILSNPQDGIYPFTKFYGDYDVNEAINYPFQSVFQQNSNSLNFKRDKIGLKEIVEFRIEFFNKWFSMGFNDIYNNALFDRFEKIMKFKKFKEYSYMMLSSAVPEEFQKYSSQNINAFKDLIIWITSNEFVVDDKNIFYSGKYREE